MLFKHSTYKVYDWAKLNARHVRELMLDKKTYLTSKRLRFSASKASKVFNKEFGDIVSTNNQEMILFPNVILEHYEEAYNFKMKNLAEYEELADFVYMMTEASEETPITLHPRDVVYMPESPILKKLEKDASLILKAQKFYSKTTKLSMPSILECKSDPDKMQVKGISLVAVGYSLKENSDIPSTAISLLYHDGRWKVNGSDAF